MGFVDTDAFGFWWSRVCENILFALWGVPEYSIVYGREVEVLSDASDPCWDSFNTFM